MQKIDKINIRPGVTILSVLKHLNYKPWYALAEFVDNAIDSYLKYENELKQAEGESFTLKVIIEMNTVDNKISIRDNAAGIHTQDYGRAFRAAELPPDTSGLSEFGMGMKSAACWFSNLWRVTSTALGEDVARTVTFDMRTIVEDKLEELRVETTTVASSDHYTVIELLEIQNKLPKGRGLGKIKQHLASIYRDFTRKNLLELYWNKERLGYSEPDILVVPFYKNDKGEPVKWRKDIDFDFGDDLKAKGFVAIRQHASTKEAGLALFRKGRVIEGSFDESFRPHNIFGNPNSYKYQRLFGELHIDGLGVSHTKDGFQWDENMEVFLDLLKDELDSEPLPLLKQAEGYRVRASEKEYRKAAESVLKSTAQTLQENIPEVLNRIRSEKATEDKSAQLVAINQTSVREFEVELNNFTWQICLELSFDPAVKDWLEIGDQFIHLKNRDISIRQIGIRVSLIHPFMTQFAGSDKSRIEPLLRVAAAIGLAEVVAIESGAKYAQRIRRNLNELLKETLSKSE
ncbi:MAG: ATP-binding protein [Thiotrichaceae bacterium IS1]|nr:MAG: ATP-binding protein [Thiotrichaceae bacterium IS1]